MTNQSENWIEAKCYKWFNNLYYCFIQSLFDYIVLQSEFLLKAQQNAYNKINYLSYLIFPSYLHHISTHFLSFFTCPVLTVMSKSSPPSQDVPCSRACVRAASASDSLRSAPWCWGNSSHTRCKIVLAACTRSIWLCRAAPTDSLVDEAW